jgi:energy-coupling factor transport system ATP-binding protein
MIACEQLWYDHAAAERVPAEWVLRDVTLTIQPGEYIALLGPNGAGKSTLIYLLKGLFRPKRGVVRVAGYRTDQAEQQWQVHKRVGIVFQNPDHQIVASTVQDDIAFGLENLGLPAVEMKRRIAEVLEVVGLSGLARRDPQHLSGGQKQRLAIASVLAMQPEVIIFDEATAMLDPQGRHDVLVLMVRLQQQGTTVIHVSHNMDEAMHAERLLLLAEGGIQLDCSPSELYAHADTLANYQLALPLHLQLYQALQQNGWPLNPEISQRKELVNELWRLLAKS